MDWKPPDFFFFLFWARTISRVSGSTSEVHSEVGKVGRGLPGPGWREEQRGSITPGAIRPLGHGGGLSCSRSAPHSSQRLPCQITRRPCCRAPL